MVHHGSSEEKLRGLRATEERFGFVARIDICLGHEPDSLRCRTT